MKQLLILTIAVFCLGGFQKMVAQEKSWSSSANLEYQSSQPEILGKGKAGYYASTTHKRRKTYLSVYHYDHSLNFREKRRMELPPKAELVGVNLVMDRVLVTYLEKEAKQNTLIATVFDQNLEPVKMHVALSTFGSNALSWQEETGDSALHLVLHDRQSATFKYLEITPGLDISTANQWQLTEKGENFALNGMAVGRESVGLLLHSPKNGMYCLTRNVQESNLALHELSDGNQFVAEALIEVDQLRGAFVVNGLYKTSRKANAYHGLSFHAFEQDSLLKKHYQAFPEDYIQKFYGKTTRQSALKHMVPRGLIPRSDGGTVFLMEEVDSETQIYRDFNYYGFDRPTSRETYYYDNIGILALSNEGRIEWNKIHRKSQVTSVAHRLFASFSSHVTKRAIILLYNRNSGSDHDLLSYGIKPSGDISGSLLLKGSESNAAPVASKARQVAHSEVIVPAFIDREKFLLLRLRF